MKGIFTETIIEFIDRKQHWLFLLVTAIASAIIYFAVSDKLELVKNEISSQASLLQAASSSLNNFVTVIVMLSVVSIMFLIPRISRKGRVEFYLSKPITRTKFFYGKVISLFAIYCTMILLCGMLVAGVLHYLKALTFSGSAYIVVIGLASFLVWFSIISFTGFMTKSVSISFAAFGSLWMMQLFLKHRSEWGIEQKFVQLILDTFYYILPKTSEMSSISIQLATGGMTVSYLPIFTSLLLAGMLFYASMSAFGRRDF